MRNILFLSLLSAQSVYAEQPGDFQALFTTEVLREDPGFRGFSASRGEQFFRSTHEGDWSCSTCHTESPMTTGQHKVTGKLIEPLAPSANPARFTRPEKVEKWFRRNCRDVLNRACTATEKGDVLAYLMSLGR